MISNTGEHKHTIIDKCQRQKTFKLKCKHLSWQKAEQFLFAICKSKEKLFGFLNFLEKIPINNLNRLLFQPGKPCSFYFISPTVLQTKPRSSVFIELIFAYNLRRYDRPKKNFSE